jgi:hypothetical protein
MENNLHQLPTVALPTIQHPEHRSHSHLGVGNYYTDFRWGFPSLSNPYTAQRFPLSP